MFKIAYSPNLKGEITVPASKNAALPIVAANFCIDNKIILTNQPDIVDVNNMSLLAQQALETSTDHFDLTNDLATKFRASILLIPLGLQKF
jgi:UDP-N-acetylglucosamine enolpyruvyl transferase